MTVELAIPENARVRWTATGLEVLDPAIPFETIESLFIWASTLGDAARWILGDVLLFAEARYGHEYAQLLDGGRVSARQLRRYRYVCERVRNARRRKNLSFSHHEEVASLEPAKQTRALDRAEEEHWTVAQIRDFAREIRTIEPPNRTPLAPPPRIEVLPPAVSVDAVRGLGEVRETLAKVESAISPEGAEALGLPRAIRAVDEAGETVAAAVSVLARPALIEVSRAVVRAATHSSGFAMVPETVWEEFVAAVAAE